jgi:hypothetical protein
MGSARVSRVGLHVPRKRTFSDCIPLGNTRASRVGDGALAIANFFPI